MVCPFFFYKNYTFKKLSDKDDSENKNKKYILLFYKQNVNINLGRVL